jgi:hypothetical protein
MAPKILTLKFKQEKITKNTVRYAADGHEDILYVYVKKEAVKKIGSPESITMTVKAS